MSRARFEWDRHIPYPPFSTLCFNNIQSYITEIDCFMSPSCSFYRKIVRSLWLRSLRSCFREVKLGEVSQKWRCHYWCLVWTKISLVTIDNQSSDPQASKLPFQHNLAPIHSTNHTIRPGRWIYQEWVRTSGIESVLVTALNKTLGGLLCLFNLLRQMMAGSRQTLKSLHQQNVPADI